MPLTSILGHREIAKRLLGELRSRPSHAYLFAGPRGVGKALVATSLVHAMMCERSPGENFCCTTSHCPVRLTPQTERTRVRAGDIDAARCDCCSACVQIATGVHPDFTYVSRPEGRSEVLIDQVRDLIARLGVRPSRSPVRMAIIDDAEVLGEPAQNALLKTLEQPPGHAIIIMVTASERALLDTVRSRMRVVRFPALQPADIEAILAAHGVIDKARASAIALLSRGSAANAIALAEGDEPPMKELMTPSATENRSTSPVRNRSRRNFLPIATPLPATSNCSRGCSRKYYATSCSRPISSRFRQRRGRSW